MDITKKWEAFLRKTQQNDSVQDHSGQTDAENKPLERRDTPQAVKHEPSSQLIAISNARAAGLEYIPERPKRASARQLWVEDDDAQRSRSRSPHVPPTEPARPQPLANKASPITQRLPKPNDQETQVLLQPETRPISQDQLIAEVKGIYAGLAMVETKCIEVDNAQSPNEPGTNKLNNEQWQALIALHRTLLHEPIYAVIRYLPR